MEDICSYIRNGPAWCVSSTSSLSPPSRRRTFSDRPATGPSDYLKERVCVFKDRPRPKIRIFARNQHYRKKDYGCPRFSGRKMHTEQRQSGRTTITSMHIRQVAETLLTPYGCKGLGFLLILGKGVILQLAKHSSTEGSQNKCNCWGFWVFHPPP